MISALYVLKPANNQYIYLKSGSLMDNIWNFPRTSSKFQMTFPPIVREIPHDVVQRFVDTRHKKADTRLQAVSSLVKVLMLFLHL